MRGLKVLHGCGIGYITFYNAVCPAALAAGGLAH